jgi:hypothetical protein
VKVPFAAVTSGVTIEASEALHQRGSRQRRPAFAGLLLEADDGDRTRDPQLGKLMLYQLSYVRAAVRVPNCRSHGG